LNKFLPGEFKVKLKSKLED